MTDYVFGFDISRWQYNEDLTYVFDWKKAKAKGIRFAGIRATVGDYYTDATLDRNVKGAQDHDIIPMPYTVPAYHDGSVNQRIIKPADAIDRYMNAIAKYDIEDAAHVLDLEIVRGGNTKTGACYKQTAVELLKHIPFFTWYTNANVGQNVMAGHAAFWNKYLAWIANYTDAAEPYLAPWMDGWECWQYTATAVGSDYGAWSESIDLDRMRPALFDVISKGTTPPPVEPPVPQPDTIQASITIDGKVYAGTLLRKDG